MVSLTLKTNYEWEEERPYGYHDKVTSKRVIALAWRNRDAKLLGMGGAGSGDIIIWTAEGYNYDHNDALSTAYGEQRGIENISFSVAEGEIFGFIGPNGAGKSTTIRTLLALIHPTSGSATIFGKDCIKESSVIAKEVGYLPSKGSYYPHMTVKELLNYTADLYQKNCTKRTLELCSRLNLDTTRKIADLSMGNKKKVGIVSALLHSPRLIILDEPTSGLDPLVQQTFFDILKEENAKGMTILFSSHVLSEVQKFCQRVAIIKDGQLIGVEKINDLGRGATKGLKWWLKSPSPRIISKRTVLLI